MKSLYLIVLFIATFGFCYLLLSLFGLLFHLSYGEVLGNQIWFGFYAIIVGWIPATLVVMEEHGRIYKN